MLFRARYERKKLETQEERYEIELEESEKIKRRRENLDQIQAKALNYFDKFYDADKDEINTNMLWVVLKLNVILD